MSPSGAFGFEVPLGDPGALDAAASSWRDLAIAMDAQGQAVAIASQAALGAGAWEGSAASAFASGSERLINVLGANVKACGQAATALSDLARALTTAQQATRQALGECERSQGVASTQQAAADEAGRAAATARAQAATAVHPSVVSAFAHDAAQAATQQGVAQGAADQAQRDLTAASTRGQQALTTYEHEAQAAMARLRAAADALKPVGELEHGWAEPVVTWVGHVNDFAGAGALGLSKGYDAAIRSAGNRLTTETEEVLADPQAIDSVMAGRPLPQFDGAGDSEFSELQQMQGLAENPLSKVLNAGLPEETFGVLGKVPYLAAAATALDMFTNRNEGLGKAVVEPVGNLVVGTAIGETAAPAVAGAVTSLTADGGMLAALGTTAVVPGVGEVVITGAIVVGGVMVVDYGVEQIWDHRAAIAHGLDDAWHGVEKGAGWVYDQGKSLVGQAEGAGKWAAHEGGTLLHDGGSLLHDAEPWNWSL